MKTSFSFLVFLAFYTCLSSSVRHGDHGLHQTSTLLHEQKTTSRELYLLNHFEPTFKNERGLLQSKRNNGEGQSGSAVALGILLVMAFAPWVFCCLILIRLKFRGEDAIESPHNEVQLTDLEPPPKPPKGPESHVVIHGPDGAVDVGTKINV